MPESKDVNKLVLIVLDMLAQNISDDQILLSLQQTGLDEKQAKDVLSRARESFQQSLAERLDSVIDIKLNEKLKEKMDEFKKDQDLKQDLRFMEQKGYTDKKISEESQEIDSLKSELVSLKLKEETSLKKIEDKINLLKMSGSTQKMTSVGLIFAAIFSIIAAVYFSISAFNHIVKMMPIDFNFIALILLIVILAFVAFIGLKTGFKIYSMGEKQMEKIGLDFISKKRTEEEGSIQELSQEDDLA